MLYILAVVGMVCLTVAGYQLIGNSATLPPPPNPFAWGNRPPWAT